MRAIIVGCVAATWFAINTAAADDFPFPGQRPECSAHDNFKVADFSLPLSPARLDAVKDLKIGVVFRYYDHTDETIDGKTLLPAESDRIFGAGLEIGVVFQHHNDDPAKFLIPAIGTTDAERALALADANRQPYGSAIYFGVDGPELHLGPFMDEYRSSGGTPMSEDRKNELRSQNRAYFIDSYANFLKYGPAAFNGQKLDQLTPAVMKRPIAAYFKAIQVSFARYAQQHGSKGYRIGMYCTGMMCLLGQNENLADLFWLSPEGRNDPEYGKAHSGDNWHLVQQLPTSCPQVDAKFEFDLDYSNPKHADFGQWAAKRAGH